MIDTTVQPKAVAFPTDAKLALIKHQRYAHAKRFKRAGKMLRKLRTYLGRVRRDIARKIKGHDHLIDAFTKTLSVTARVMRQKKRQAGPKVYAQHAPEVECIGKGKAHKPYEFGVKVSVATPLSHPKGGQFVIHAHALSCNPYYGHTLATVVPAMEKLTGAVISRGIADAGYKGNNPPRPYQVYVTGQKRGVTPEIKRLFKRRAAVEPVIGHLKDGHRMGRYQLAHRTGDAINAVMAAVGYNFMLLVRWFALLLRLILECLPVPRNLQSA